MLCVLKCLIHQSHHITCYQDLSLAEIWPTNFPEITFFTVSSVLIIMA